MNESRETTRGGEQVLIRRIQPEDLRLYPDFVRDVGAEDLRLRFFARVAEFTAAELRDLGHLADRHQSAVVALDEKTGEMLGLARLKNELDEETAEFAILVRSRIKGHGLGWLLMRRVIDSAREQGLRRVYGDVLAENSAMLQMCAELGFREEDIGSGMTRVALEIERGPEQTPDVANLGMVRPPVVYLVLIAVGSLLEFFWPLPFMPRALAAPLGIVLVVAAVALFFASTRKFSAAGTPVPGNKPTTAIVRAGPYRFSRNPIYLAFSLLHLGIAAWANSLWLVATLIAAVAVMAGVVIRREEEYLEKRFGAEYLDYKKSVRRWI